jgi:hypothetical protein
MAGQCDEAVGRPPPAPSTVRTSGLCPEGQARGPRLFRFGAAPVPPLSNFKPVARAFLIQRCSPSKTRAGDAFQPSGLPWCAHESAVASRRLICLSEHTPSPGRLRATRRCGRCSSRGRLTRSAGGTERRQCNARPARGSGRLRVPDAAAGGYDRHSLTRHPPGNAPERHAGHGLAALPKSDTRGSSSSSCSAKRYRARSL